MEVKIDSDVNEPEWEASLEYSSHSKNERIHEETLSLLIRDYWLLIAESYSLCSLFREYDDVRLGTTSGRFWFWFWATCGNWDGCSVLVKSTADQLFHLIRLINLIRLLNRKILINRILLLVLVGESPLRVELIVVKIIVVVIRPYLLCRLRGTFRTADYSFWSLIRARHRHFSSLDVSYNFGTLAR